MFGVTRTAGFAAHVFSAKNNVLFFVDSTGEYLRKEFFGRPVVGLDDMPQGALAIGHEAYELDYGDSMTFTLANGAVDILSKELRKFSVMDL